MGVQETVPPGDVRRRSDVPPARPEPSLSSPLEQLQSGEEALECYLRPQLWLVKTPNSQCHSIVTLKVGSSTKVVTALLKTLGVTIWRF